MDSTWGLDRQIASYGRPDGTAWLHWRFATFTRMVFIGHSLALAFSLVSWSAVRADDALPNSRDDGVVVELEIPRDGERPIVVAESFGKKLRFLIHTTSPTTTFDVQWIEQLGTPLRTESIRSADGRVYEQPYFGSPGIQLGPLLPHFDNVAVSDLSELSELSSRRIDGFFGLDLLSKFVVTIDGDRGVFQLRSTIPANPGDELPLHIDESFRPVVSLALGGRSPIPIAVSTASPAAILLRPSLFVDLRDNGVIQSTNPTPDRWDVETRSCAGYVSDVALGPFVHRKVGARTFKFDLLGMEYLARYIVTLDIRQRKAYFKPARAFRRTDRLDQSGMAVIHRDGEFVVDRVMANSPASEEGILFGDVIRRINDLPVTELSLVDVWRALQMEGKRVTVAATRAGKPFQFQLNLRSYHDANAERKRRSQQRIAGTAAAAVIKELEIGQSGEPLVVPLVVDGFERPLMMLVDTGSASTTLRQAARKNLGEQVGRKTVFAPDGQPASHEMVRIGSVMLGGVRLCRESIALVESDRFEVYRGILGREDLDGVLGMDLLQGQIVQIDFDAGKLRLMAAVSDDCGDRLELMYKPSGIPSVATTLGETDRRWFVVDTGCTSWSFCHDEIFSRLLARGSVRDVHPGYELQNSRLVVPKRWRLESTRVGPFDIPSVGFASAQMNALGLLYLSRYVITFDFPGGALYLKKGKLHDRPEPSDASGLQIMKYEGLFVVYDVSPGSPASDNGIAAGDVVERVNGRDVTKYSMFELNQALSKAGEAVDLTFRRRREMIERRLLLRDFFVDSAKNASQRRGATTP